MTKLVEREYEIKFKIKCWVDELDKQAASDDLVEYSNFDEIVSDPAMWLMVERQQRLLAEVLKNDNQLELSLRSTALHALFEHIEELTGDDDVLTESMLVASKNMKNKDDVDFFEEVENDGLFHENTDHVYNRFIANIESMELSKN